MTAFGIIFSEFASSDEHYVGKDEILLAWLLANNYGDLNEDEYYPVPAPEGYVFRCGSLFKKDAPEIDGLDESELSNVHYASVGSPENDKAIMLREGALKPVSRKDFIALELPDDRVLEYMIY